MATKTTTPRKSKVSSSEDGQGQLEELFSNELKDIYYAEKLLVKALPRLHKAATTDELKQALEDHLVATEEHVTRLEEVFEMLDQKPKAKKCEAMDGITKEATQVVQETEAGTMTRDAGIIIAAQKAEHYEIASYGSLVQLAKTIGKPDVADILAKTLNEEKDADQLLSDIAMNNINGEAEVESNGGGRKVRGKDEEEEA